MEIFLLTWSGPSTHGKFCSSSIPQEIKKKLKNFPLVLPNLNTVEMSVLIPHSPYKKHQGPGN